MCNSFFTFPSLPVSLLENVAAKIASFEFSFVTEKLSFQLGSKSGREIDKVAATGLTPFFTEAGNPVFEEARLTLECKVVYKSEIEETKFLDPSVFPRWYDEKNGNAHIVYIAEIVNAWEK